MMTEHQGKSGCSHGGIHDGCAQPAISGKLVLNPHRAMRAITGFAHQFLSSGKAVQSSALLAALPIILLQFTSALDVTEQSADDFHPAARTRSDGS
jgi:hypothetical protein